LVVAAVAVRWSAVAVVQVDTDAVLLAKTQEAVQAQNQHFLLSQEPTR